MNKIDEIHKKNSNLKQAVFLGVLVTLIIGYTSINLLKINIINYMTPDKLLEIVLLVPSVICVFIIHELIHVVFFLLFGKGKAKIKVSRERSVGAVIMHQVNEEVYYSRLQMVVILLSPIVFLTIILLGIHSVMPVTFLIFINIVLNALGSTVDIYITYQLIFKYKSSIYINFNPKTICMNIYNKN